MSSKSTDFPCFAYLGFMLIKKVYIKKGQHSKPSADLKVKSI